MDRILPDTHKQTSRYYAAPDTSGLAHVFCESAHCGLACQEFHRPIAEDASSLLQPLNEKRLEARRHVGNN